MLSQPTTSVCSSCAPCSTSCPRFVNRTEFNSSTLDPHLHNFSSANAIALIDLESSRAHIFSVSSRNADGLRIKRTREMRASCLAFGIPSPHCIVLDHSEITSPFSLSLSGPARILRGTRDVSLSSSLRRSSTLELTLFYACPLPLPPPPSSVPRLPVDAAARSRRGCPKRIHRYGHRPTVNKARRLAPVPTPQSVPLTPAQYWEGRRAFNRHRSQHAWFQRLWLVSSRFMWIHELHRVVSLVTHSRNHPAILTHSPAEKITFPVEPKKTTPPEPDKLFPPHAHHHTDARPT
ncbi:hypothetical protein PTTG_09253 [Puccinia triticina 1-1 BBBD Race 1]|uniref:N-acetylglucosaminylphosphatidylinositol deacetylase n=1 Tax=Puccinia triticina (isolate 1-1 / race 1 (BBBD)) TaxID=630390 RepID=A0A180H0Z2_PUCT1|nr:hypothetical protein PTTG_09253 [Puccinia triticina 1-1 BBBD Race 1]